MLFRSVSELRIAGLQPDYNLKGGIFVNRRKSAVRCDILLYKPNGDFFCKTDVQHHYPKAVEADNEKLGDEADDDPPSLEDPIAGDLAAELLLLPLRILVDPDGDDPPARDVPYTVTTTRKYPYDEWEYNGWHRLQKAKRDRAGQTPAAQEEPR